MYLLKVMLFSVSVIFRNLKWVRGGICTNVFWGCKHAGSAYLHLKTLKNRKYYTEWGRGGDSVVS